MVATSVWLLLFSSLNSNKDFSLIEHTYADRYIRTHGTSNRLQISDVCLRIRQVVDVQQQHEEFSLQNISDLKNMHFLIWKWTEPFPAGRCLYTAGLRWLAGTVASSTRDPEDFIIPPSPPSACTSPFPLSLTLSTPFISSSPLHSSSLQSCFKSSVLHLIFSSLFSFQFSFYSSVTLNLI